LRVWHETYKDQGLVVIGNHYPEFAYEHNLDNLRAAIERLGVPYPVLQDNDRETWAAYQNRYWPTTYLIDKQGNIRYRHIGEGAYVETEDAIRALLAESYAPSETVTNEVSRLSVEATVALNVRSGPGTNYSRIGIIHPNEAYTVLEESGGWYRILFDGAEAYVSGEYVSVNQ